MGEKNSKEATTINPNNYSPTSGQKPEAGGSGAIIQFIENKVRQVCPDGNLTPERFKEVLLTLEQYGFPQLRDTPTGFRLYEILTKNGSHIRLDQFMEFIGGLVSNTNETQLKVSFDIMDKTNSGVINLKSFQSFAFDCWMSAFRNLNTVIQNYDKTYGLPPNGLESWANSRRSEFVASITQEFSAYDPERKGYWTYENFKQWAKRTKQNSIYAAIGDFSIIVPMHVYQQNLNSNRQEDLGGFVTVNNYNYAS